MKLMNINEEVNEEVINNYFTIEKNIDETINEEH